MKIEFLLALVFFCSIVANIALAKIAPRLQLIAHPGAHRQHSNPTPLVGGLAVFLVFSLGLLILKEEFSPIYYCMLLMLIVGIVDDRFHLPSWVRIVFQGITAYLMVELTGTELNSLGQLVSDNEMTLGKWSLALTIFAMIGVINAVNMSDGMDGLAGSLVIMVLLALLYLMPEQTKLIVLMCASITGFLVINARLARRQAKVFLGDAGSMMLGVLLAWLLISGSQQNQSAFQPVTALWLLAIPLYDAVAVLLIRPLLGKSPFEADHSHYHHFLRGYGLSVNQTLLIILLLQSCFILAGIFMNKANVSQPLQFGLFLSIFLIYLIYLFKVSKNK